MTIFVSYTDLFVIGFGLFFLGAFMLWFTHAANGRPIPQDSKPPRQRSTWGFGVGPFWWWV